MDGEPHFGNGPYWVCFYCKSLRIFEAESARFDDNDEYACNLQRDSDGRYPSVSRFEQRSDDLTLLQKGCGKFESSGLPIHPTILDEISDVNPLTKNIPVDSNATEDGFEFDAKVKQHLPKEQIQKGKDLVYRVVLSS